MMKKVLMLIAVLLVMAKGGAQVHEDKTMIVPKTTPLKIGVLIAPGYAIMDVTGGYSVFGMSGETEMHLLWKNKEIVIGSPHFPTVPTTTFADCPDDLDVLIVGAVAPEVMGDPEVIEFLATQAKKTKYLIGVCSGTVLLGAAGLIDGYKATTNIHVIHTLKDFGAITVEGGEVVEDRNLFTAGPAAGSFETALRVLAKLRGEDVAKLVELSIEYHPNPPFNVGTPELAGTELTKSSIELYAPFFKICTDFAYARYLENKKK